MLEMGNLTENRLFFLFHLHTVKPHLIFFYKTEIVRFSAISTE